MTFFVISNYFYQLDSAVFGIFMLAFIIAVVAYSIRIFVHATISAFIANTLRRVSMSAFLITFRAYAICIIYMKMFVAFRAYTFFLDIMFAFVIAVFAYSIFEPMITHIPTVYAVAFIIKYMEWLSTFDTFTSNYFMIISTGKTTVIAYIVC